MSLIGINYRHEDSHSLVRLEKFEQGEWLQIDRRHFSNVLSEKHDSEERSHWLVKSLPWIEKTYDRLKSNGSKFDAEFDDMFRIVREK